MSRAAADLGGLLVLLSLAGLHPAALASTGDGAGCAARPQEHGWFGDEGLLSAAARVSLVQRSRSLLRHRSALAASPAPPAPAQVAGAGAGASIKALDAGVSFTFRCHQMLPWGSWLLLVAIFFDIGVLLWMYLAATFPQKVFCPAWHTAWEKSPRACAGLLGLLLALPAVTLLLALHFGLQGRLEFVHIPKNAGTAIEFAGVMAGVHWSRTSVSLLGTTNMPDGNQCNSYHVPPALLPGGYYDRSRIFCVVRHPYDRAVSEYLYLLNDDLQIKYAGNSWGQGYADLYSNGLYDYKPCTAMGLNHFVQRTLLLYKQGHMYIDDCHHVPQAQYVWGPDGTQWCTDVLRIDNLPQAFNRLMVIGGYKVHLDPEPEYTSAEFCPNVSVSMLDEESRRLLREVYAEDFQRLNFTAY